MGNNTDEIDIFLMFWPTGKVEDETCQAFASDRACLTVPALKFS